MQHKIDMRFKVYEDAGHITVTTSASIAYLFPPTFDALRSL